MKRDEDFYLPPKKPVDFGLFAPNTLHFPAKSAPGSETSREAAELVSIDGECLRCLRWFAGQKEPRTRQELAMAVYPPKRVGDVPGLGPACGRVADLVELKYLEEVGRSGKRATLTVTEAGRRWLAKREAA